MALRTHALIRLITYLYTGLNDLLLLDRNLENDTPFNLQIFKASPWSLITGENGELRRNEERRSNQGTPAAVSRSALRLIRHQDPYSETPSPLKRLGRPRVPDV